jgi:hypothetical protein
MNVTNFIQSNLWKKKHEKNPNKILFPFLFYFDEFETHYSLGTLAGLQKRGAINISLPSILIEQCFLTWVPRRSLEGSAKVLCCVFIKILRIEKS